MIFGKPPDHLIKVATLIKDFWRLWVWVQSACTITLQLSEAQLSTQSFEAATQRGGTRNGGWLELKHDPYP
jgi:hypothetical protein